LQRSAFTRFSTGYHEYQITESFPRCWQKFFTQRLIQHSTSVRVLWRLTVTASILLAFAHRQLHKSPSDMAIDDLDTPLILAFLNTLR